MSVPRLLVCAVLGHDSRAFCVACELDIYADIACDLVYPHLQTLGDLLPFLDEWHSDHCSCGLKLGSSVWRANISYGVDCEAALALYRPTDDQRLDSSLSLQTVFPSPDVPPSTIHLVFSTDGNPGMFFRLQIGNGPFTKDEAESFPLALRGLRHVEGRVCRVLGSQDPLLPQSSDFSDIANSPGCFYIERFDWIVRQLGCDRVVAKATIPIIRRPPGFGKTTFLTTVSACFDLASDRALFPFLAEGASRLPPPMLVLFIDLSELAMTEHMADDELAAECERVMWGASAAFYEKYAPLLGHSSELFLARRVNGSPYGVVRALARDFGRKIFLAIDNYTSPFMTLAPALGEPLKEGSFLARVQLAISRMILAHVFVDVGTGAIARGLITGTVLPNEDCRITLPLSTSFPFLAYTTDLTTAVDCSDVIGITRPDIETLVKLLLRVPDGSVAGRAAEVVPREYIRRLGPDDMVNDDVEVVYAAGRVIKALRAAMLDAHDEWADDLHVPASESSSSTGSAPADRNLQTPVDAPGAVAQVDK